MDTAELMRLVEMGRDAWNQWADENPGVDVNFKDADFSAPFSKAVSFSGFRFNGIADFSGAKFSDIADFSGTTSSGRAYFSKTTFIGGVTFRDATFSDIAYFSGTTFSGSSYFSGATFSDSAYFNEITFSNIANFTGTTFISRVYFLEANFMNFAKFDMLDVQVGVDFTGAKFTYIPSFSAVRNPERIIIDGISFKLSKPSGVVGRTVLLLTGLCPIDKSVEPSIRNLRGIANKTHAIDAERDLTILERNAQVGASWKGLGEIQPIRTWFRDLSTVTFQTPLLLLYRWSSNYGKSVLLPLLYLIASPFVWFLIYFKLYLVFGVQGRILLSDAEFLALKSIAIFGAFPVVGGLRSTYTESLKTLFGDAGSLPLQFQIALSIQTITSLIFVFLVGLALRNFFRLK